MSETRPERERPMDWALRVSREVKEQGGKAEQRLRDKCRWEQMTRTAVILGWGDPREWK